MGERSQHYTVDQFLRRLDTREASDVDFHTLQCEQCRLVRALVERVWGAPSDEDSEVLVDWLRSRV
jgi:hypothetical protein